MGVMRFSVRRSGHEPDWPELAGAYLSGFDGRVYETDLQLDGDILSCHRESATESARLHVAYPVPGFGRPILCTASLREREEPYLLALELARGRLGQLLQDGEQHWRPTSPGS